MPRKPRTLPASAMLHIICRSNNKLRLFTSDEDFKRCADLLLKYTPPGQIYIHHYVLMHTHLHMLAWCADTTTLALTMKAFTVSYHHYYCKHHEYRGHLWHGRFRTRIIEGEGDLLQCGRYIELNPVFARICAEPHEYPWSSYHHYALGKHDPLVRRVIYPSGMNAWKTDMPDIIYQEFIHAGIDLDYQDLKKTFDATC